MERGMNCIDEHVRLVTIQFSSTNLNIIPVSLRHKELETEEERILRESRPVTGVRFLGPKENCFLEEFVDKLEAAGYELVDASEQERLDRKDASRRRVYGVAQFVFARREFVRRDEIDPLTIDSNHLELERMLQSAFWRVQVSCNPLFEGGEIVEGENTMCVNCDVRQPRFEPSGKPITKWRTSAQGHRLEADGSVPIEADFELLIADNRILIKDREAAVVA